MTDITTALLLADGNPTLIWALVITFTVYMLVNALTKVGLALIKRLR